VWFPATCMPDSYTPQMGGPLAVGSCCPQEVCPKDGSKAPSVGAGCSFHSGGSCAVLQFNGTCPWEEADKETWRNQLRAELATAINARLPDCSFETAQQLLWVVEGPNPNQLSNTYRCRLQLMPPPYGAKYNTRQMMVAIAMTLLSKDYPSGSISSHMMGTAAYAIYGSYSDGGEFRAGIDNGTIVVIGDSNAATSIPAPMATATASSFALLLLFLSMALF